VDEALLENHPPMTKTCFCKQQSSSQMRETLTTDIFQFSALEQVPHPLLRIELGYVAGKTLQM